MARTLEMGDGIMPRTTADTVARGDILRTEGIGRTRSGEGRTITTAEPVTPAPDYGLTAINELIIRNAPATIGVPWNPHIDRNSNPQMDTTNRSDGPTPLYGTDDPFSIMADLALRLFPNEETTPQTTYVPVIGGSGGGGGNAALILIVLAALAGGAWWYFKKRGANA
jgi:hypothetical protein